MRPIQSIALSIAGFDPSAGAGVLADIKTFEQTGVYGCGITTCITYQNDQEFMGVKWLPFEEIKLQFNALGNRFLFEFVKIGIVEDIKMLESIIDMLLRHNQEVKIIWDPVFKTSSGFLIHNETIAGQLANILDKLYLVTPNSLEAEILKIDFSNLPCRVLITGGHSDDAFATDVLHQPGCSIEINGDRISGYEKHGSGCVLSAAVTAFLALGYNLEEACRKAKDYTRQFLFSNNELLGRHNGIIINENHNAIPY